LETGEQCDGTAMGGATCKSRGFCGGVLSCTPSCAYSTTACTSICCGDGIKNGSEQCDGTDLGSGHTTACSSFGLSGAGPVKCNADCSLNTAACTASTNCGNGVVEPPEQCEGEFLNGNSCESLGYEAGTLVCNAQCTYDVSSCSICGDGVVSGTEACDGSALGGATCASIGYLSGSLGCAPTCDSYDLSGCIECNSCRDCNNQACINNTCASCRTDSDCCSPLRCSSGVCTL
jgi:hypothetical protein